MVLIVSNPQSWLAYSVYDSIAENVYANLYAGATGRECRRSVCRARISRLGRLVSAVHDKGAGDVVKGALVIAVLVRRRYKNHVEQIAIVRECSQQGDGFGTPGDL